MASDYESAYFELDDPSATEYFVTYGESSFTYTIPNLPSCEGHIKTQVNPYLVREDGSSFSSFGDNCCDDIDIYNSCKATGSSMCVYHDATSNSIMHQFDSIVEIGALTWSFYVYFHYFDGTDDYSTELSYYSGDY